MALSALGYAAARIEDRDGDVFVGTGLFADDPLPTLHCLGAVRNIKVNGTARETSPDSHNRTYQKGVDLEVSFEVMQTGYAVELKEIPTLINSTETMLKISDTLVEGADAAALSTAAYAADGLEFEGVKLIMGFALDYGGEDSVINLMFKARLSMTQVAQLGTTPVYLGG